MRLFAMVALTVGGAECHHRKKPHGGTHCTALQHASEGDKRVHSAVEGGHEQCIVQRVAQQLCVGAVQTYRKDRFEQPQESPF